MLPSVLFFLALSLSVAYALLIRFYLRGWKNMDEWNIPAGFKTSTFVSILIPARNEALNISECIESILRQDFPEELMEIIVIDDFSTDNTAEIVNQMGHPSLRLLQLKNFVKEYQTGAFKKKAIETAISQAQGSLILTTDADCIVSNNWLNTIVSFYETYRPKFIAAPVSFHGESNGLERFQSLDFHGMMLITAAGIQQHFMHMSNGANLAYPKSVFESVNGFKDIDHIASGDDLLLMHKVAAQFPGELAFVKSPEAQVFSKAEPTIAAFFNQRMRWAGKNASYTEWKIIAALGLVFVVCWSIVLSFLMIPFCLPAAFLFLILFGTKSIADYYLLSTASRFFKRKDLMKGFWLSQLFHILYIAIIGLLSQLVKRYKWKGREVS